MDIFLEDIHASSKITRCKMKSFAGTDQPSGATLLLHESISDRDLAVCFGSVRSGLGDDVRRGSV